MPKNESYKKICTNSLKIDEETGKNYLIETNSISPAYRSIFYYCYGLILQTNSISQKIAYDPMKKIATKGTTPGKKNQHNLTCPSLRIILNLLLRDIILLVVMCNDMIWLAHTM